MTMIMNHLLRLSRNAATRNNTATAVRTLANLADCTKTSLYDWHKERGGDMVPFAGYALPVLYKDLGVMKEHHHCRKQASVFDVSHMGQIVWRGKDRIKVLERLVVANLAELKPHHGVLSLITNKQGGILDDTVITNAGDDTIYMVVNGATKHDDMAHFDRVIQEEFKDADVSYEYMGDDLQLLAVQGPQAAEAVSQLLPSDFDLTNMAFMTGCATTLDGVDGCRVTRCGYTGEDGFELSIPAAHTESIANKLLDDTNMVQVAGLGARDSLRLEAGLCLYGNDLDETTTPHEAALAWTLGPPGSRRRKEGGFLGDEHILNLESGKLKKVARKRVGIMGMKAPARGGVDILDETGDKVIGTITSGTFSPILKRPIAMGYVETAFSKADTPLQLKIRNKLQSASVTKIPFVESKYYRVPSSSTLEN